MNVLFLTDWYPTADRVYNGIFVREHAKAARASGDTVTVLHVPMQGAKGRRLWTVEEELDEGLTEGLTTFRLSHRSIRFGGPLRRLSSGFSYAIYVWSVVRACRRLRARGYRPDVIHAHEFSAGVPAVVVGRLTGTPVVVTEHYTAFPRRTLSWASVRMARFAFRHAARVLPVCLYLQRAIEAYGVRARFVIVPNAVDASIFHSVSSSDRAPGPRRLLFVGNLEPTEHKGFPTLVKALELMHERRTDWHLEVVGEGPARAACERRVAESSIAASVTFRGALVKSEVAEVMRKADLFVLPSRFENLPCVIIEAMSSGLPVVSTTVGGIPEMMSERDGILVGPDDALALAAAIERVLADPTAFDPAAISARALARYGLPAIGSQLHAVYDSVAGPAEA